MAWSPEGLLFNVRVEGKKQPLWCRDAPARRQRRASGVDRYAGDAQHPPREPLLPSLRVSAGGRRARQRGAGGRSAADQPRPRERPANPAARAAGGEQVTDERLLAGRVRAGRSRSAATTRSSTASSASPTRVRPRVGHANLRHGPGVSVRRRSNVLGPNRFGVKPFQLSRACRYSSPSRFVTTSSLSGCLRRFGAGGVSPPASLSAVKTCTSSIA